MKNLRAFKILNILFLGKKAREEGFFFVRLPKTKEPLSSAFHFRAKLSRMVRALPIQCYKIRDKCDKNCETF
jgi:hypothetical protein